MQKFHYFGGLEKLAGQLEIVREGSQHQAGSDSRVTLQVMLAIFHNMQTDKKEGNICQKICDARIK